jgi:hypothetical protein
MFRRLVLISGLAMVNVVAFAEDQALAIKGGAFGLGVEYTYDVSERLSIRGGINGSQLGFDADEAGIEYDVDWVWDSLSIAVDFHPRRNALRLTLGVLSNDNGLETASRLSGPVTVGDTTYTSAQVGTLRGTVSFDGTAPFAGVGWDWSRAKRRFGMSLDLGLLSQGSPVLTLSADGGLVGDPAFEADLAAEKLELEESLEDLDVVPYVTLGFVFRF